MNDKAINPPYRPLSAPEFVLCAINMCDARKENDAAAYECALEQLLQYLNIFAKHGWITRSIHSILDCYDEKLPSALESGRR